MYPVFFDIFPVMPYIYKTMKEIFRFTTKRLIRAAVIAALYAALTVLLTPLSYGPLQIRFSEALTILPLLLPEAVIGVTVGCLIANIFTGMWTDMVFGTLATLIAAILTYLIGRAFRAQASKDKPVTENTAAEPAKVRTGGVFLAALPPVIVNALIIPAVIFMYLQEGFAAINIFSDNGAVIYLLGFCSIFIGQAAAVYGVGVPLYFGLRRIPVIFRD